MSGHSGVHYYVFRHWAAIFVLICHIFVFNAADAQLKRLQDSWQNVDRVVAIGDIHGDFEALKKILFSMKLVSERGAWIGGHTHLVLLGDLIGHGGPQSKKVLDYLIRLEKSAARQGGVVHSLIGNHDMRPAAGDFSKLNRNEKILFVPDSMSGRRRIRNFLLDEFLGDGEYAKWILKRPIAIKINDILYVHAGLDERTMSMELSDLNRLGQDWILFFQGKSEMPEYETQWIVGLKDGRFDDDEGPLFMRDFKVTKKVLKSGERPEGAMKKKKLKRILEHFSAAKMVIGHVPTPDSEILLRHPYYGKRLVLLDSRISSELKGQLSALEIINGEQKIYYFDRPKKKKTTVVRSCRDYLK